MSRLLERIEGALLAIGMALTVVLMLAVVADAAARYFAGGSLAGVYELSSDYLVAIIVFSALGYAYSQGSFVRITILLNLLPPGLRGLIGRVMLVVGVIVTAFLTYAAFMQFLQVFEGGRMSNGRLQYPMWPVYLFVFAGMFFLLLRMISGMFSSSGPDDSDETLMDI